MYVNGFVIAIYRSTDIQAKLSILDVHKRTSDDTHKSHKINPSFHERSR